MMILGINDSGHLNSAAVSVWRHKRKCIFSKQSAAFKLEVTVNNPKFRSSYYPLRRTRSWITQLTTLQSCKLKRLDDRIAKPFLILSMPVRLQVQLLL
jgi:hypothetical protein